MAAIFLILSLVASLCSLVCWIITLIKIFKSEGGIVHGIIGIICGLWALIYGWMKADEMDNRKVMTIWTACIVANIVLNILTAIVAGAGG